MNMEIGAPFPSQNSDLSTLLAKSAFDTVMNLEGIHNMYIIYDMCKFVELTYYAFHSFGCSH